MPRLYHSDRSWRCPLHMGHDFEESAVLVHGAIPRRERGHCSRERPHCVLLDLGGGVQGGEGCHLLRRYEFIGLSRES